jgi:hypothetical protein
MKSTLLLGLIVLAAHLSPLNAADKEKKEAKKAPLKVDPAKKPKILKVLELTSTEERVNKQKESMVQRLKKIPFINAKQLEAIKKSTDWSTVKDNYLEIYSEVYTAKELDHMINYYNSDLGKSIAKKQFSVDEKLQKKAEERQKSLRSSLMGSMKKGMGKMGKGMGKGLPGKGKMPPMSKDPKLTPAKK